MSSCAARLLFILAIAQTCDTEPHATGLYVSSVALSSGDGSECAPFVSLDTAIMTALEAGGGTIYALGTEQYELHEKNITAQVFLEGEGAGICLKGKVNIESMGLLSIKGLIVENYSDERFDVRGRLAITNSTFRGFNETAIKVTAGVLIIDCSMFENGSKGILVSASQAFVNMSQVTLKHNRGSLFFISDEFTMSQVQIQILDCIFESNNGESLISMLTSNPLSTVSVDLSGCQFANNSATLLGIAGFNIQMSISSSIFHNNRNGVIFIEANQADISLVDCDWTQHTGKAVEVIQLIERITFTNTSFRQHFANTPVYVANTGNAAQCFVFLANTTFLDSSFTIAGQGAGFFLMKNCVASIAALTIRNVAVSGLYNEYKGLLDIQQGLAELRQLTFEYIQSSQVSVYFLFSSISIVDFQVFDISVGINGIFFVSLTDISLFNLTVNDAIGSSMSDSISMGYRSLVYFVLNMNNVRLKEIEINAGTSTLIFGQYLGNFSAESIIVRDARVIYSILLIMDTVVDLSGMYIENCTASSFFTTKGQYSVYLNNVSIVSSHFEMMVLCRLRARCNIANVKMLQSSFNALAMAIDATIDINSIKAVKTVMKPIMKGFAGSILHASDMSVRDSEVTLAEVYGSQAKIANSEMHTITCWESLIVGVQSTITLQEVAMSEVKSETSVLADLTDSSTLEIIDTEVKNLSFRGGIKLTESKITITGSSFIDFRFTLIIGVSAMISITNSQFRDGGPTEKIALLHGGLLSCVKCENVKLINTRIMSIHSSQGGGLYLSNSVATITGSVFQQCSAINGGALAFINSEFHISESNFTLCSASSSGGAIDVLNSMDNSDISHSTFTFNSAKSGGAVNIRKAVPMLKSVNFAWNTAEYGSDVASFTVAAKVSSSFPINVSYVSGNPLPRSLKIELLDHFGQVVLTDSIAQLSFDLSPNVSYGGMAQAVAENGIIDLGTAPFYVSPNSTVVISSTIQVYGSASRHSFDFSWELSFRPCQRGEVRRNDRCEVCPRGNFSLSMNDTQCELCSAHAYCPGGSTIELDKGYWRTSLASSELLRCPFSAKCAGGQNSTCEEGYTGKLCSECNENWYRVGTLYCRQCSAVSAAFQVIAFLLQYFAVFFTAFYVTEIAPNEARSAALQIWVDFCQCTAMLLRLRIEQPLALVYMYQSISYLGSLSATALPISCLIHSERSPYLKMLTVSVTPVAAMLAMIALVYSHMRKITQRTVYRIVEIMIYFAGAAVIEAFAALLLSTKLGSGSERWLFEDASIESWSPKHIFNLQYLYSPILALYILVPLLACIVAFVCCRLRKFTETYCPLITSGLRDPYSFAQFILYYWKLLFILVTMSVTARAQLFQITLSLSMLIVLIPAIVALEIYAFKPLLLLSVGSKVLVFCSLSAASYYMEWSSSSPTLQYAFTPVILILYVLVLYLFLKIFIEGKKEISPEYVEHPRTIEVKIERASPVAALDPPPNSVVEWCADCSHAPLRPFSSSTIH